MQDSLFPSVPSHRCMRAETVVSGSWPPPSSQSLSQAHRSRTLGPPRPVDVGPTGAASAGMLPLVLDPTPPPLSAWSACSPAPHAMTTGCSRAWRRLPRLNVIPRPAGPGILSWGSSRVAPSPRRSSMLRRVQHEIAASGATPNPRLGLDMTVYGCHESTRPPSS